MKKFGWLVFVGIVFLTGCASGFEKYYVPNPNLSPEAISSRRPGPPPEVPALARTQPKDGAEVYEEAMREGYAVLGVSLFHSVYNENAETALKQGKKVGADMVLLFDPAAGPRFTQMVPVSSPFQATSQTSTTGSAYGVGGSLYGNTRSTTTTTGSTTSYVPQNVQHTNYGAVFLVKQTFPFGADVRDLDDSERRALQSNRGVVVRVVVNESPAYFADIMPGDIITSFGSEPVSTKERFDRMVEANKGKRVKVAWIRDGQAIEKSIQMD